MSGKNGESTGNERRKGRIEEAERDSRDREKNRLTSLHLIGSSCNHRGKNKTKQNTKAKKRKKHTTDDRKQSETRKTRHKTARHREEREQRHRG